jgi:plastocyanin
MKSTLVIYGAALASFLSPLTVHSDSWVSVSENGFSPSWVSIGVGETVYWVVEDDFGPYTISSPAGDWSPRYLYDVGDGVGITFNEAGDYDYYDAFTLNSGVVHVGAVVPNAPPVCSITTPSSDASFASPASFTFSASAFDSDDGLWDVEFYLGDQLIDDVYAPPYTAAVSGLAAGQYVLRIIAYDFSGATATASVSITVGSGPATGPSLGAPTQAAGRLQLPVSGLAPGGSVVLLSCPDLMTHAWVPVQTNQVSGSSMVLSVSPAGAVGFLRVVQRP